MIKVTIWGIIDLFSYKKFSCLVHLVVCTKLNNQFSGKFSY